MVQRQHVVVAGGSVGGLGAALGLGRAGHQVTVIERDVVPGADNPEAAFTTSRRGAPQAHQTHGFLARLRLTLRARFPDVLADLETAGCHTMRLTGALADEQPGDSDLAVLVLRRTTLEWALRRAAAAEPTVTIRGGVGVAGITGRAATPGAPAVVTGITLDDGEHIAADTVVAATGRRDAVPTWLASLGVDIEEREHATGLVYLTRWYRLPAGLDIDVDPKLAGDLGFLKYIAVPGDGDTFSVTLAVRSRDKELRSLLADPDRFDRACRSLPAPARFFAQTDVEPITDVLPMGGLVNRLRRFVDADGQPLVTGFHAIGDAHTCTNPIYGRGCALALVQAGLVVDAFDAHPHDAIARASAYEAASKLDVEPWFHAAVQTDKIGRSMGAGDGRPPEANALGAVFAAAATDGVLARGLMRVMNLLQQPNELMTDAEFVTHAAAAVAADTQIPPIPGPSRAELLDAVAA